jgi:hypothetical protein
MSGLFQLEKTLVCKYYDNTWFYFLKPWFLNTMISRNYNTQTGPKDLSMHKQEDINMEGNGKRITDHR